MRPFGMRKPTNLAGKPICEGPERAACTDSRVCSGSARDGLFEASPTITFVGDLEPFLDETLTYVQQLQQAHVPVEFQLFKGCFHAFELVAPKAKVSQSAWAFLLGAYGEYWERYY